MVTFVIAHNGMLSPTLLPMIPSQTRRYSLGVTRSVLQLACKASAVLQGWTKYTGKPVIG